MKPKKFKNSFLLIPLCMFMILLWCSWGEKPVELLDDKKLIDLNKAIEFMEPGGELITPDDPAYTTAVTTEQKPSEEMIYINVRGEQIKFDGEEITFEELEAKLRQKLKKTDREHVTFKLADNFAEAHVYRNILGLLRDMNEKEGVKYAYE